MRKLSFCIALNLLLLVSFTPNVFAATTTELVIPKAAPTADELKADSLTARLYVISSMDRTNMSATEKKTLRKEVRSIKKNLKEVRHGLYISIGAAIIIILLLILLF
jgi:hypothetical protein